MKIRQHNNVTYCIGFIYNENRIELSNLSNRLWYVTKTRKDNNMTNCISALNTKKESKLSWSIELNAICDENQTGQRRG